MLAKHFGDIVKAARELNVDRSDLRKLTWHNPRILNAAHERMDLFRIGVRSKIIEAVYSPNAKRRRWGFDAMMESYEFRDQVSAYALLAPAPRRRGRSAPVVAVQAAPVVDVEAVWEGELEQAAELERERAAEFEFS